MSMMMPEQGAMAPAQQPGLPPELLAMFQGAASGAPPQGPAQPTAQSPAAQDGVDPIEHLRAAIEHAQAALVSEPDDADSQLLAKVVQGLYQILASRQKEQDQALGNPGLARVLRRA